VTDNDKALVTQADMDAAFDTGIRLAKSDWLKLYEAFARHRKQAIEAQAAEIERLRVALGLFVNDKSFVVQVGGNPNVVPSMIATATKIYFGEGND
jgi:hypothetical protein